MKILNLMNKKKLTAQGSITVFMTFIFMIILSLILAIFENTRIISSTGYMKNASLSAEKTLFGDYNLELYKEYGLFGYGGYNGLDYDDMCQEFREIVKKNLCVKPENALLTYTDIYKIKNIAVKTEKSQGFKDGDNWDRQIKACLVNDTVDEIADKIKNKHSEDGTYDEKEVYKKLDDADSYETGKYKEKYGDKNENGSEEKQEKKEIENSDKDGNKSEKNDKTEAKKDKADEKRNDMEDADIGNPLEMFKELVQNGYLSLVCDISEVSNESIEKALVEDGYVSEEKKVKENVLSESSKKNKAGKNVLLEGSETNKVRKNVLLKGGGENKARKNVLSEDREKKISKSKKHEKTEDYESAGSFLKNIFSNTDMQDIDFKAIGSCGTNKLSEMIYAEKKLTSYAKSSASAVDYGMEYLICGKENERDNLTGVINRIISMRMLINFAIISKDEVIKAKALATATAIAGITGIEPVIKGVQYAIIAILAFEESCIDTAALLDGKKIPLLKNTTDIKIKYEEICTVSGSFFREKARQYQESDGKITANFIDYREYLFAFLAVVPEEKIKSRLFDIIQHDLRTRYNESFRIHDCIVAADYNITYSMKFVFPFLWNMYGKDLKYKKFRRQVSVSYRYG